LDFIRVITNTPVVIRNNEIWPVVSIEITGSNDPWICVVPAYAIVSGNLKCTISGDSVQQDQMTVVGLRLDIAIEIVESLAQGNVE
jgi:FPC/CPF motif-containing protein YcgG